MSVSVIAAGTALAGYGELNVSIAGMFIQLISETAEAGRLIMTQTLLQGMSFHPIEGLMYLAPASLIWMSLGVAFVEGPEMVRDGALTIVTNNPGLFVAAAGMGFAVMSLAFFTIQLCGSLTLKVCLLSMTATCRSPPPVIDSVMSSGASWRVPAGARYSEERSPRGLLCHFPERASHQLARNRVYTCAARLLLVPVHQGRRGQ